MDFCHFARNIPDKYVNKSLDAATKTGQDTAKAASKKEVHKTAEATGELIWNKIAEKSVKRTPVPEVFSRNAEEIVIPLEKKMRNIKQTKKSIRKWNTAKYLNY